MLMGRLRVAHNVVFTEWPLPKRPAARAPSESGQSEPGATTTAVLVVDDDPEFLEQLRGFGRDHLRKAR